MASSGSICSECSLVGVQAGWDAVLHVLENQFFKICYGNEHECQSLVVSRKDTADFSGIGNMVTVLK